MTCVADHPREFPPRPKDGGSGGGAAAAAPPDVLEQVDADGSILSYGRYRVAVGKAGVSSGACWPVLAVLAQACVSGTCLRDLPTTPVPAPVSGL